MVQEGGRSTRCGGQSVPLLPRRGEKVDAPCGKRERPKTGEECTLAGAAATGACDSAPAPPAGAAMAEKSRKNGDSDDRASAAGAAAVPPRGSGGVQAGSAGRWLESRPQGEIALEAATTVFHDAAATIVPWTALEHG